jgi:Beta-glucosidase-related glycosidases
MTTRASLDRIKQQVNDLLAKMTVQEKIAQLGAYYAYDLETNAVLDDHKIKTKLINGIGQITRIGGANRLMPVEVAKAYNQIQHFLVEKTRLRIPAINHEECCAGLMAPGGSIFPEMIGLASTFTPDYAGRMTAMIREQMLAVGGRQALAPVLDVARDPRWGRVEETFGEDSTLVSQFGVSYIKGLQSSDLSRGVMATGKHFVGHAFSQGGLNCGPVHLGMRDIWDTYLAPFQAAIRDAGLASMMNAYPELDGEVVATSRHILTGLLRETLGFDGVVVSDYDAVMMIHNYHYAVATKSEAAVKALTAGIDVELPTVTCYGDDLLEAINAGKISMEVVDTAVERHLQKKFELGLFENPFVDEGKVAAVFETKENRALAYEIATKGMVLLKNDGVLPLKKTIGSIAVIGPNASSARNLMGDYSFAALTGLMNVNPPPESAFENLTPDILETPTVQMVTVLDGIKKCVGASVKISYAKGCDLNSKEKSGFAEALSAVQAADVAILVMGDRSGLAPECTTGEFRDSDDLRLQGVQEELIEAVAALGKPVVLVLVSGRPAAIPEVIDRVNAVLEAWVPGEEGGNAVASILFGDVNPGGKLPISIPRSVGQVPVFYNHKPSGMHSNIYGDYVSEKVTPLFPFGYGLSYTQFEYSDLKIDKAKASAGDVVTISLQVSNSGKVAGDEVVQLYLRDEYASMPRPVKELRGFVRVTLQPGEKRKVSFALPVNQMAFYDLDLKLVVEAGRILVMVGSSSEDIRLNGEFNVTGAEKTEVRDRVLVCPVEIE